MGDELSKSKKTKGYSEADIADLYDDRIEEMLADSWMNADPRDLMDLSLTVAAVNAQRQKRGEPLVALPPDVHRQINAFAEKGMYKGLGQRYPRRYSALLTEFLDAAADEAREKKEKLVKTGVYTHPDDPEKTETPIAGKVDATNVAATETARMLRAHGIKRKSSTMVRDMSKRR
jgi:hypothetical protein